MISVSVGEAKNRLPYFLHLVEEKGEVVQITRHRKTVAVINNQQSFNLTDKRRIFIAGLQDWRQKYSQELSQMTNEQIDMIFNRNESDEPIVRHSEDFE